MLIKDLKEENRQLARLLDNEVVRSNRLEKEVTKQEKIIVTLSTIIVALLITLIYIYVKTY